MRSGGWLALAATMVCASMHCLRAQSPDLNRLPPGYRGVTEAVPGIFLTPVPNAPFSGTVEIVSHSKLPDGSEEVTTAENHLARSSSGRIYQERHPMVAPGLQGKTPVLSCHVYDPNSRTSWMEFPLRHLARQTVLRAPERAPTAALPPERQPAVQGVVVIPMGEQMLDGMRLTGFRKERIVPAAVSGTGNPVTITDEYWYSPELSIYMTIRHNDPRTGEQMVVVTHVERAEPPAEQFVIPAEYKVVDETTPEGPAAAQ